MKKKFAIVYCIHHKPWLIMSTIISTILQNCDSFDIFFLYNKGSGEKYYKEHKIFFDKYDKLKKQYGKNQKLDDSFDPFLTKVCKLNSQNIFEINLEDDHGLDSGAWYKFISMNKWVNYDYTFFMGEGALFTHNNVLTDTYKFMQNYQINFISGASNKRYLSQKTFLNNYISNYESNELKTFHDDMLKKTFEYFQKDPNFNLVFNEWHNTNISEHDYQEHHIPNVWGGKLGFYFDMYISKLSGRMKIISSLHNLFKIFKYYFHLITFNFKFNLFDNFINNSDSQILVNYKLKKLSDLTAYKKIGSTNFHISSKIGSFGTHCNFVLSNEALQKLSNNINKYKIDLAMKLPYSATALEPIWSLIPRWLGYELWFFNGIHRVFKNHFNNKREDNPINMSNYLNIYFKKLVLTKVIDKKIIIMKFSSKVSKNISVLNKYFFKQKEI